MRTVSRPLLCALTALALIATVAAPWSGAPAQSRLRVLATLPDLWAITRAVVGDLGEVQVATRPGQNPHDQEIRPSQFVLVKRAEILVRNCLERSLSPKASTRRICRSDMPSAADR